MVVFVDLDDEGLVGQDGQPYHQPYLLDNMQSFNWNTFDENRFMRRHSRSGSGSSKDNHATSSPTSSRVAEKRSTNSAPRSEAYVGSDVSGVEMMDGESTAFSIALGCYPVVKSLVQWLDLNSLFSLSLTCRQFRANLLQFRSQIVKQTLRCQNDPRPLLSEAFDSDGRPRRPLGEILQLTAQPNHQPILLAPKVGKCARDLVGECRRCGRVVCRNCTVKPPADPMLRDRFRRLCATCQHSPLKMHTIPQSHSRSTSHDSEYSHRRRSSNSSLYSYNGSHPSPASSYSPSPSSSSSQLQEQSDTEDPFTLPAFSRDPCQCATRGVWLCQPCGQGLRASDITYKRVWTWRSRYSTHIGGLGTGMGEGNQGQKCGRGGSCLAAKDHEVEIDCSPGSNEDLSTDSFGSSSRRMSHASDISSSSVSSSSLTPGPHFAYSLLERKVSYEQEPGYFRQEIEGIGGVVKKKVKKRVRVGATVVEFDDEKETGKYLLREMEGRERSWCGWCWRVVPGEGEEEGETH